MNSWKINIRYFSLLLVFLFSLSIAIGKGAYENSKTIEKTYPADQNTVLNLKHKHGPLTVEEYQGNEIQVQLIVQVTGDNEEELVELLKEIELDEQILNDEIEVSTKMNVVNWNTNNRRTKITFKSGLTVKEIEDLSVSMTVKIPAIKKLGVQNKYDEIRLSDLSSALEVDLYSGSLKSGNIQGDLQIKTKYSKLEIGRFGSAVLDFYDSKASLKDGQDLEISSKYSEIELGHISALELDAYDDEYEIGNITGNVDIKDKYSEIKMGNAASVVLDIYDGKVFMDDIQDLRVNSKYSEYKFGRCQEVVIDSYDDDFSFASLQTLDIEKMKYSSVDIQHMEQSLIAESYDSEINVESIGDQFERLSLDCKYDNIKIPIAQMDGIEITAESKYGKLQFNTDGLENLRHIKDGSTLQISGKKPGGSRTRKITIIAYDSNIEL